MPARHRRWVAVLIGLGSVLLLLEIALQALAYRQWLHSQRAEDPPPDAARRILCIGDSFTYGIGASGPSTPYPAVLQRMLRESGHDDVAVINGGWPGRTSAAVLQRLAAQIERYRPRWVYVLVGYNDRWNPPPEVLASDPDFDIDAFEIRWRTGRLAALILDRLWRGADAPDRDEAGAGAGAFVGTWHHRQLGTSLVIEPEGTLTMDGKAMTWTAEGKVLWLRAPELPIFHRGFPLRWRMVDGDSLSLASERWEHVYDRGPPPPGRRRLAAALAALDAGRHAEAATGFRACLDDPALELRARDGLVRALAVTDPDAAAPHLERLRGLYAARHGQEEATALARALAALGRHGEAFEMVCRLLEEHGHAEGLWQLLTPPGGPSAAQTARAITALRRAAALDGKASDAQRATVLRTLAAATIGSDPVEAVRCLMQATATDGVTGMLAQTLEANAAVVSRAVYETLLAEIDTDDAGRARLRATGAAVFGGGGPPTLLERHLERIVAHCRSEGATPILLDYPLPFAEVEGAIGRVCAHTGADHLRIRAVFDRALEKRAFAELFDQDQLHPNDEGYALMARPIAADAHVRLTP